ncbi:MAG: permease prefix domain 1-containing protein [Paludibaculum sp.]
MPRRWLRRLRYWLNRRQHARFLMEEMEAHLETRIQELQQEGMTESEARRFAHREFGNPTLHQEASRETWIARWLQQIYQDTVFALRTLRKQPGFAAAASLSAALGIGACSMIFGLANHALLRPLPVEEPARLMSIAGRNLRSGRAGGSIGLPRHRASPPVQFLPGHHRLLPLHARRHRRRR